MSRIVVLELLQALKFKSPLPDTNLLLLVQVKKKCSFVHFSLHEPNKSQYFILTTNLKPAVEFLSLFVQISVHG